MPDGQKSSPAEFGTPTTHGARAALRQAERALAQGDRDAARRWVTRARYEAPDEVPAWLWQALLAATPEEAHAAARQALRLAPANVAAQQALAWAQAQIDDTPLPPAPTATASDVAVNDRPDPGKPARPVEPQAATAHKLRAALTVAVTVIVMVGLAFLAGAWGIGQSWLPAALAAELPTAPALPRDGPSVLVQRADELWTLDQRDTALAVLTEAHRNDPNDAGITAQLAQRQAARAAQFIRANDPDRAHFSLSAAHELMPNDPTVAYDYQTLVTYLAGREAYQARNWEKTIAILTPLFERSPGYMETRAMLEAAYTGRFEAQHGARASADQALLAARNTRPGHAAREALVPPTPYNKPGQTRLPPILPTLGSMSKKHIVVSIHAQRMYVYENNRLIWNWVASTGEPKRPTVPGKYRIQDKIPNARSNVWTLWMPYWMGIYWAGSVENGIHGQVTFDNGGRLWDGFLGRPITFGCVMISDANAATLFNWAEIGTPVSIHWDWDPSWIPDANGDPIK
ncbi:MAG: L,D-transpeptidase [Ardenticatenaceae bacterium]|nr:L,D-transpeptidase [Ardenticatenaceae bacterium]